MHAPEWISNDVSRETLEALRAYCALVAKWNITINLVSKASLAELETRHIWDSAQLFNLASGRRWADLGSGGGFPGIVVAILAKQLSPDQYTLLVESDQRKAAFLRTAIRELSLNAEVLRSRIEDLPALEADVLSARALTDLSGLLGFAAQHLTKDGTGLFPKGRNWAEEIAAARKEWNFSLEVHTSHTEEEAAILAIKDIERV